ncbi:hypothetical protein [Williamsia sp. M5A3_1d]
MRRKNAATRSPIGLANGAGAAGVPVVVFAAATGTPSSDRPIVANADTGVVAACFDCVAADRRTGGTAITEFAAVETSGADVVVGAGAVEVVGAVVVVVVLVLVLDDAPVPEEGFPVVAGVIGEPVAPPAVEVAGVVDGVVPAGVPDAVDDPLDVG